MGPAARFDRPRGISVDGAGNLYVLDRFGGSLRKVTPGAAVSTLIPANGTIFGTTLAATPSGEVLFVNMTSSVVRKRALDGTLSVVYPGSSGSGTGPVMIQGNALVLDSAGVMYAVDFHAVWRLGSDGSAVLVAGKPGALGYADGPVGTAQFDNPSGLAIDSAGVMYVADQQGSVIRRITPDGVTTTLAGVAKSAGTADGTGAAARFRSAAAMVCDPSGNLYVGEGNSIRKVTPQGVVTTIDAGSGISSVSGITRDASGNFFILDSPNSVIWKLAPDGALSVFAGLRVSTTTGVLASLQHPVGLALDVDNNLLFSDIATHTVNRLAAGTVSTIAGASGTAGSADGYAVVTANLRPSGVAVDRAGIVYFSDGRNHVIRRVAPDGWVSTIAGRIGTPGAADGTGSNARFNFPGALTIDAAGNLLVGDYYNCAIRSVTPAGVVTTVAGRPGVCGNADGDAAAARLGTIGDVAVDAAGNILIADPENRAIRRVTADRRVTTIATGFADVTAVAVDAAGNVYANNHWAIQRITPSGQVTTVAGAVNEFGSADGSALQARFGWMYALAFAADGTLYIADESRLRALSPGGTVTTVAGSSTYGDGVGRQAGFDGSIYGLAFDAASTLYLTESAAIRRMTPATVVDTYVAGIKWTAEAIDGAGRSTGRLNAPRGLAGAPDGSIFIADTGNHTIRRLAGNLLTTIAGSAGLSGNADGGGTSARFNAPAGLARDIAGNLYVADSGNHAIRKIASDGTVTTIAATLNGPRGVTVDSSGTLYVADTGNHVIRVITPAGLVSTLAGTVGGSGSADGTGAAARFSSPEAIALVDGTLYVADTGNHTIRAVTTSGAVTTVGGTATAPGFADGTGSSALFFGPAGLASDPAGALYVAEPPNAAVRIGVIGTSTAPVITTAPVSRSVTLHESVQLTCDATGKPSPSFVWEKGGGNNSFFTLTDGAIYRGVTTRTLTIADVGRAQDGTRYRCVAKNVAGATASAPATLAVAILTVSPTRVGFGGIAAAGGGYSSITSPKTVTVGWRGPGAPAWSVSADKPWVQITNGSGNGAGQFTVSVGDPGSSEFASIGSGNIVTARLTFTAADPELSLTISISFARYSSNAAPTGVFETPANNATGLQGSLAVTGWALDDIDIDRVEIWRDAVAGETTPVYGGGGPGNGKIFISTATFVPGARPDVEALFGWHRPDAWKAGWGYMLLTQGLWNRGNGTYKLYAFAFDKTGAASTIGTKTITIDNANATKPFGTIDTPSYGGTVSGVVTNFGWALTPGATCTITDPNVQVSIDSGPLTPVVYGGVRTDVAAAFPEYTNAAAAGGHSTLDTTTLTNGMHTIGWVATDSCGRAEGMGSRFFTVANSGSVATAAPALTAAITTSASQTWSVRRTDGSSETAAAAADGTRVVRIAEGERIELQLPGGETYMARQAGAGSSRDLPIGSSFDASEGRFYWQPAAGFLGAYDLEFAAVSRLQQVRVVVGPPIRMAIDTPGAGSVLAASEFTLAGWAVDLAALEGAGIDTLHVWAYPVGGGASVFVGVANSGGRRPDVAALYGPAFSGAGFTVNGRLAPGTYDLVVYAHSAASNSFAGAETVRVVVR